jgi:hypothetical protein
VTRGCSVDCRVGAWPRALEAATACTGARTTDLGGGALRTGARASLALSFVATAGERDFLFLSELLSGATAGRFVTRSAVVEGPRSAIGVAVASRADVVVAPSAMGTRAAASRAASAGSGLVTACVAGVFSPVNSVASLPGPPMSTVHVVPETPKPGA